MSHAAFECPQIKTPLLGSYPAEECLFLLKEVNPNFKTIEDKEKLIQSGQMHYSEMINQESAPSAEYSDLFYAFTEQYKVQLAAEVMTLARAIIDQRDTSKPIAILSLARAGTPIGVLLLRALRDYFNVDVRHFSISIIRDKGIDTNALDYVIESEQIEPENIVFVDGWTAKGVITQELKKYVNQYNSNRTFNDVPDELFVISDIGGTADVAATYDDYTIPSALMNSTVSGLISRTILNDQIGETDFHGCIIYDHLRDIDLSNWFVEQISAEFTAESIRQIPHVPKTVRQEMTKSFLEDVMRAYQVGDYNRVKPGIAEATRVMLRRVPDVLIVQEKGGVHVAHLERLAQEKGIQIVEDRTMPFGACALIKDVT